MKESIKKRIEAVRRGEVPEGYVSKNHQLRPADWKYEKIGKYLVPYDEFSNDTEAYPLATSSRQGLMLQSEYYSDQRYEETTGGFHVVPVGYVTYRHMSDDDIFRFNVNKMGQPVLVSPEYPVFTTTGELDQELLVAYLNGVKEFQAFCSAQKKGSTRTRMYFHRLGEFTIPIPSITEQQKIAEILKACDRMIELKQRKIDELNKLKQVCLLEMFPKEGQAVPEIRFKGFTAPWEQRKAIDIADYSKGNGYSKGDLTDAGTPIILYGRLYTKYQFAISEVDTFAVPRNGAVYSQGNEVIVPASGETAEDIARASAVEKSGVLLGGDLNILRPFDFINPLFLALAISNGEPQKELAKKAQGKSVVHIHNTDIQEVTIAYPSRTEQDRIVSVFRQLDHLITLHQRILEEEKRKKKALMQLLLTGLVRVNA